MPCAPFWILCLSPFFPSSPCVGHSQAINLHWDQSRLHLSPSLEPRTPLLQLTGRTNTYPHWIIRHVISNFRCGSKIDERSGEGRKIERKKRSHHQQNLTSLDHIIPFPRSSLLFRPFQIFPLSIPFPPFKSLLNFRPLFLRIHTSTSISPLRTNTAPSSNSPCKCLELSFRNFPLFFPHHS